MLDRVLSRPVLPVLIIALLSFYLFAFQSGKMALTDPDETFYAQTAKEMYARGEWITPYLYGKPQFEKPILFYWALLASYHVFGVNEFAARMPSAVFAFAGLIAIYLLGAAMFGRKAGFLSSLIMATAIEYIVLSRACITDMTLNAFMLFGFLFFILGHLRKKEIYYLLCAAAFALATLTKGPVAVVLSCGIIMLYLLVIRDLKFFRASRLFWMSVVFIVIAAPWYLFAYKLHGNAFIDSFFGFHNVTRFVVSEHKIGSEFYYNLPILLGGMLPWSIFLPAAIYNAAKGSKGSGDLSKRSTLFLSIWFLVIFVFFSVSSTKLPTYIFPCFGSVAILLGAFWSEIIDGKACKLSGPVMNYSYMLMIAAAVAGLIAAPIAVQKEFYAGFAGTFTSMALLLLGIIISAVAFRRRYVAAGFFILIYGILLALYPFSQLILPEIERFETSKAMSQKILSYIKPGERLGSESHYRAGLAYYTGIFPTDVDKHHVLVDFVNSKDRVWIMLKEKNHRELYELETKPYCMAPSYMVYKFDKKCIVTNVDPGDGKYLVKRERKR